MYVANAEQRQLLGGHLAGQILELNPSHLDERCMQRLATLADFEVLDRNAHSVYSPLVVCIHRAYCVFTARSVYSPLVVCIHRL
jgi:hypothetical protein